MLLVMSEDVVNTPGIQQIGEWSVRRLSRRGQGGQHAGSTGMVWKGIVKYSHHQIKATFLPSLNILGEF